MKRILVTGKNSYIGNSFAAWIDQWPEKYQVEKVSMRNDAWKKMNWQEYDVVLNVAGIAHIKESPKNEDYYYQINRDLAIEIAEKAKKDQVSQFIQISSMSVFGAVTGKISEHTDVEPVNSYGESKLEADNYIMNLSTKKFQVSILRPPMVYGPASPGNFVKLYNFINKYQIFPKIENKRSMIYIDNLSECLKVIIDNELNGYFYPQNNEYINTFKLASTIAKLNKFNLKILPNIFNWISLLKKLIPAAEKVFGDLYYEQKISDIYDEKRNQLNYNIVDFEKSIYLCEAIKEKSVQ